MGTTAHADRIIAGSLVVLGAVAAGIQYNDQLVGLTGDNATYILLARDLITGQTYENAGYPWGYPALLAPILAVVGANNILAAIPWLKLLTILLFLVSLPLIYALFRTRRSALPAFVAVMLFAVNSSTLYLANDVMSEIPYICASFGALLYWQKAIAPWGAERLRNAECGMRNVEQPQSAIRNPHSAFRWRSLLLVGLLLLLPYYIRAVGVSMLVAPLVVLFLYRRWRAMTVLGLTLALGALPWVLASRGSNLNSYSTQLLLRDPYNPSLGAISNVGELIGRVIANGQLYVAEIFPKMAMPDPTPEGLRSFFVPIIVALVIIGFLTLLVRRVSLPEVYTLSFLLVICIWPWTGDRFLLPVYPLFLYYALEGGIWLALQVRRFLPQGLSYLPLATRYSSLALIVVALAVATPNVWLAGISGTSNMLYLTGQSAPGGHTPDWQQYFAACRWLNDNTPPGAVIMSRKTTLTTIYSNRPSVQIPLIPSAGYPAYMRDYHVGYVLEDAFDWSTHTRYYLRPALAELPDTFQLVKVFGPPQTRIWKVVK